MRWIAGACVVLGCGYVGVSYAGGAEMRIRQLKTLEQILCQLEFNIDFLLQPFPGALKKVAGSYPGALGQLLWSAADRVERTPNLPFEKSVQQALEETAGIRLKAEEREILLEFFRHTGQGDREKTRDGIRLTGAKIRVVREQAEEEREKDGKLWRSMGFLGGLLIVLLLM